MKNKFFVYTTNNYWLLMHVMLVVMVMIFIGVAIYFAMLEIYMATIAVFIATIFMGGGALVSERLTVLGDYILLNEDGVSYRHNGSEKLFIAYYETEAAIMPGRFIRGRRYQNTLIIGSKGSLPAKSDRFPSIASFSDGWFLCAYDKKLVAALEEKIGAIVARAEENEPHADTGVIDGVGQPAPKTDKGRAAHRRKIDDTHDDDTDDRDGGWRCD